MRYCFIFIFLTSCMVGPKYQSPNVDGELDWIYREDDKVDQSSPIVDWWSLFSDPQLNELIELAFENNLDLEIAALRVLEARAERGIAIGSFFPQFQQIQAEHNFEKVSKNISEPPLIRKFYLNSLSFDVSWELDLWGKFRRGIAISEANLYASLYNYEDVMVSLAADVAATYMQICLFNEQIAHTLENIRIIEEGYRIANARYRLGDASNLDVQEALSVLETTKSILPTFRSLRRKAQNNLCVLLGISPTNLDCRFDLEKFVPVSPSNIIVGTPCDLIRRRPDVRSAEAEAYAQCQKIGIAISDMLPNISLLGSFGWSVDGKNKLIIPSSSQVETGIGLNWNVLNYGRLSSNVKLQKVLFQESIVSYQNTILRAFQEVEDGMVGFLESEEAITASKLSVEALKKAAKISMYQYKLGLIDFNNVLTILNQLVLQTNNLAFLQAEMALSLIATQKALGGGW